MSGKSSAVKGAQLGMPHGTASAQLRKKILFHLLVKLREAECFKCGQEIESADELSIDHKDPWLHSDDPAGRFFDLENIAFSHRRCNKAHHYGGKRIQVPDGMVWCSGCKEAKPEALFGAKHRRNGKIRNRTYCNPCRKKRG